MDHVLIGEGMTNGNAMRSRKEELNNEPLCVIPHKPLIRQRRLLVWKTGGSASHERKSPSPITWLTCHVIGAWSRDAEHPSFHCNTGCYHGNMHRFHGYLGLNGNPG